MFVYKHSKQGTISGETVKLINGLVPMDTAFWVGKEINAEVSCRAAERVTYDTLDPLLVRAGHEVDREI